MINQEAIDLNKAINIWNKYKVKSAQFNFYCGGDSMGDTSIEFHYENIDEVKERLGDDINELEGYLDSVVYDNVEFYECSDGHYMGESGYVEIELDDDEGFCFIKYSEEEWRETVDSSLGITFSDKEFEFIKNHISSISGGYGERPSINFSKDFIMTDEMQEMYFNIESKLDVETESFEPSEGLYGELEDWFNYENHDGIDGWLDEDNKAIVLTISNEYTIYRNGE